ncbi:hypothetical protein P7C70_g2529, partial [Phenoliferia sp. Uapishka_3]
MTSLSNEEAFAELYFTKKAIKDVLGVQMRTILWEQDTVDYDYANIGVTGVESNYEGILALQANGTFATEGTVVLSHELDNETMTLSEEFLPQLMKQFTGGVMPIAVCTNNTQPYVEAEAYVYPNQAQYQAGTKSILVATPTVASRPAELMFTSGGVGPPTATGPSVAFSTHASSSTTSEIRTAQSVTQVSPPPTETGTSGRLVSGSPSRRGPIWRRFLVVLIASMYFI